MVIVPTTGECVSNLLLTLMTPCDPIRDYEGRGNHSVFGKGQDLMGVKKSANNYRSNATKSLRLLDRPIRRSEKPWTPVESSVATTTPTIGIQCSVTHRGSSGVYRVRITHHWGQGLQVGVLIPLVIFLSVIA